MRPALFLHIFDYQQQGRHTANFADVSLPYLGQLLGQKTMHTATSDSRSILFAGVNITLFIGQCFIELKVLPNKLLQLFGLLDPLL